MDSKILETDLPNMAKGSFASPSINDDIQPIDDVSKIPEEPRMSQKRIIWNLFVTSFSYFLFFNGFWSLSNLESTVNAAGGMGPDSQAVIYGVSMLSSLMLPEIAIRRLGAKKTYVIAILLCCPYVAANLHLRWDTMMISAVIFGLASGPLNTAQTLITDEMAKRFAAASKHSLQNVTSCFFGFFMFFSESTQIWGNVISYLVLRMGKHRPLPRNFTVQKDCGIHFRPSEDGNQTNTNLDPPAEEERLILFGIYSSMGVLAAVMLICFLDPLKNDIKDDKGCQSVYPRLAAAVRQLKNPNQLLLLPLSIFCGMEGPFYSNEITEAYIACSWGVHHVGFVTICFGVCGALMAILVGPLVGCVSQMSVIILAALINVTTCALLFVWEPSPDVTSAYFVVAGVWGMGDAIWWSQIPALYGMMFPAEREAAFSNFFFWSFLGYFISYSYANYFTIAVKINILLCFLITGMVGYLIGQYRIKRLSSRGYTVIVDSENESS